MNVQKQGLARWCALCMTALVAFPASAWGPKTKASVVLSSGHVFSKRSNVPNGQLQEYLKLGVYLSAEDELALYPDFSSHPINSIQREIYLLQSIKSDSIDPYFVYRMGALGKKVVELMAPMRSATPALRDAYYSDVEKSIARVNLTAKDVQVVNSRDYFTLRMRAAAENDRVISYDYKGSIRFQGVAGKSIHKDTSRAVAAVADVWHTIFTSPVNSVNISKSDMREYVLKAIDFHLKRNEIKNVKNVYKLAETKGIMTAEIRKKAGDLYYDNEYYEEALHIYHALLSENPRQRDVSNRVAQYHILMGDRATKAGNLEDARDAYQLAVQADAFEDEGSIKLTTMDITIQERDNRNIAQQKMIALAQTLVADANDAGRNRDYAAAIKLLQQAQTEYAGVTDEFPQLSKKKTLGMYTLKRNMTTMKESLIKNTQQLSGSGFVYDAKRLASMTEDIAPSALHSILKAEYESAVKDIGKTIATP